SASDFIAPVTPLGLPGRLRRPTRVVSVVAPTAPGCPPSVVSVITTVLTLPGTRVGRPAKSRYSRRRRRTPPTTGWAPPPAPRRRTAPARRHAIVSPGPAAAPAPAPTAHPSMSRILDARAARAGPPVSAHIFDLKLNVPSS